jgi:Domain of unknown function (DUF4350)
MTAVAAAPEVNVAGARRSARIPLLLLVLLVAVTAVIGTLAARGKAGELDPDSYEPGGAHAVTQLLTDAGVAVHVARSVATARSAEPGATLLITAPDLLPGKALRDLVDGAAGTVLIAPGPQSLSAAVPELTAVSFSHVAGRDPGCTLPAAVRAGRVQLGGFGYRLAPGVAAGLAGSELCYAKDWAGTLARIDTRTVLGSGAPLTNARLDARGNAALVLALLGERRDLVWFRPQLDDPALAAGGHKPLTALLPTPLKWAALQLAVAAGVLALWRARRLGPVVTEPLPVTVRAAESTEGLARLYRRAGARQRAGTALREAAVRRLAARFGLRGGQTDPRAVVEAIAAHTSRPATEVGALLFGQSPDTDPELVALADALDALEQEIRNGRRPPGG